MDKITLLTGNGSENPTPSGVIRPGPPARQLIELYLSDTDVLVLVAALDARDRYLAGIAERQLNYRPTETRNRKLDAIEAERRTVEYLKHLIVGLHKSIYHTAGAPAQTTPTP